MSANFQQVQREFCDWIRQPEQQPLPDQVERSRMQVYRELLFNNVCDFVDRVYPVAQSILPTVIWQQLKADFFSFARCDSPFYMDISRHFREYLSEVEHPVLRDYPWLLELLQVEWLELYLDWVEMTWPPTAQRLALQQRSAEQWMQVSRLLLAVPIWVLAYQWPVYQWRVGDLISATVEAAPGVVVAWRDQVDQAHLEPVMPITALVLEWMVEAADGFHAQSLCQQLQQVLPQLEQTQAEDWLRHVLEWLQQRELLMYCGGSA